MKAASVKARVGFWARADRLFARLGEFLVDVSSFMLLAMVVLMGVEIVSRAIFKTSTQIADEYSGYLFTWMSICGFVHAQRGDRFLRVDSVRATLSPRVRAAADALAALLGACLVAILVHATWATFQTSFAFDSRSIQPSQTLLWIPQAIMPLGLGVLFLGFLFTACTSALQAWGRLPLPRTKSAEMAA